MRDLMTVAVESRFGQVNRLTDVIEWLTDNGSGYIAKETRRFCSGNRPRTAEDTRPKPPIQRGGQAFVRTIKRDYARVSPMPNAEVVMLPAWVDHSTAFINKVLNYR